MNTPRILIVDDRPSNLKALRVRLSSSGYEVIEADNGEDALVLVGREQPDLVLLDVMMPRLDGYEVCRRMKKLVEPGFLPIILITALSDSEAKVTGLEAGADDFLNKPVDPGELRARVKSLLHTKTLHDNLQQSYKDLKRAEAMRESLTQMIVHDLRNPLAAVMGYTRLLQRKGYVSKEERAQRALHAIDMSSQTLIDMITALLDLAKFEAGEMQLKCESVDLFEVLYEVDMGMHSLMEQKDLTLDMGLPGNLARLHADRECLRRIFINILSNAITFSPQNGYIHIAACEDNGLVCVKISDEGPGIPSEARSRIFDKFGQVENQQSGKTYSTGLGLAFCKIAVEAHRGTIDVESEIGKGATFILQLPAEKCT